MDSSTPPQRPDGAAPAAARPADQRQDLLGLSRDEIRHCVGSLLDRPYRAEQIHDAIYRQGVSRFEDITTLDRGLRSRLSERFRIGVPEEIESSRSSDGTRKVLLGLADGATIEAVDIPSSWGSTLCLSSQAGCALGCTFCVTGYWGAGRNLTAGEIVGQVLALKGHLPYGTEGLNLVMMGMGEPLHNIDALHAALELVADAVSWRRMTVSTVGVVDGIRRLAEWPKRPNLAVSLHAPDDDRRSRIMPINRTHPLAELMDALHHFPLEKGRRITFEYLLIRDFNDRPEDAVALGRLVRRLPSKVNLIPINPDPVLGRKMVPPSDETVRRFATVLSTDGVLTTVRRRRGDDVRAACGQLRAQGRAPRGFRRSNLSF